MDWSICYGDGMRCRVGKVEWEGWGDGAGRIVGMLSFVLLLYEFDIVVRGDV